MYSKVLPTPSRSRKDCSNSAQLWEHKVGTLSFYGSIG
jgi:hypothetical protein